MAKSRNGSGSGASGGRSKKRASADAARAKAEPRAAPSGGSNGGLNGGASAAPNGGPADTGLQNVRETPAAPGLAPLSVVAARRAATREEISARAHQIWLDEGRPQGRSLDHWVRAERELS